MKHLLACFVSLIMSAGLLAAGKDFTDRAKNATALLYAQDEAGGMRMYCTATAFEKTKTGYKFVSAAHCVGNDDTQHEKVAPYKNIPFYITFDQTKQKIFYTAKVLAVGYQHRGDDFSVYEVETREDWPTVPIGDERKEEEGNPVLNIASPLGLGRQVFHGSISKLELDRPVDQGDIHWTGTVLLQLPGVNGGSSGSAVISEKQEAIVAFLVGTIGNSSIVAIPASRFVEFSKLTDEGKYRWALPAGDE